VTILTDDKDLLFSTSEVWDLEWGAGDRRFRSWARNRAMNCIG